MPTIKEVILNSLRTGNKNSLIEAINENADASVQAVTTANANSSRITENTGRIAQVEAAITAQEVLNAQQAVDIESIEDAVEDNADALASHESEDGKHGIFTVNGIRYQGLWVPNSDLTGMKFIYEEVE